MKIHYSIKEIEKVEYPENTRGYWINKIKDPTLRNRVFECAKEYNSRILNNPCYEPQDCFNSFIWDDTAEGYTYWQKKEYNYLEYF